MIDDAMIRERIRNIEREKNKSEKKNSEIDMAILRKKQIELERNIEALNLDIREMINKETDNYIKVAYQSILELPSVTEKDYEYKKWIWNYGDLRTSEEIKRYEKEIRDKEYYESEEYRKDMRAGWWLPFVPLLIYGMIVLNFLCNQTADGFVIVLFGLPLFLFLSVICCWILPSYRISIANLHNVPKSDPKYQREVLNKKIAAAATIGSAVYMAKKTKDCIKETADPDTWKQV